ncbi:hypothetical protein KJ784_02860 [Patescibacteria group bacterium]|nr:hypothetical protein [Patescibacteria group bacterium]
MDLFPKDYKKNGFSHSSANSGPGATSSLKNFKDRISSGNKVFFISSNTKETLARLGVILIVGALGLVLLLWGGLIFYGKSLAAQISDLKKKQAEIFSVEDKKMAAKIVNFDENAVLIQSLLKKHIYSSAIFDKLSLVSLPRVQWRSFDLLVESNRVALKGFSADYATLAKQMLALEEEGFTNLKISNILLDKTGLVSFMAAFNFDPKILQK